MINFEKYIATFKKLYGDDEKVIKSQIARYKKLIQTYQNHFQEEDLHLFSTPGRTEIGGNHTDHNHGRVLAAAVDLDSIAVASVNNSDLVMIYSEGYPTAFQVNLQDLNIVDLEKETTLSLIRGIAARLKEMGYEIGGFNACISSKVLPGSGLSSSASIEVLLGTIFNALFNQNEIKDETLALVGQYAENKYFGKPSGLMDQMTCAVGSIITIDFKEPEDPLVEKIKFDFGAQNYNVLVVDTGGSHADLTDEYASIPIEMQSVAQHFGQDVCRNITLKEVLEEAKVLREKVGDRALLRAMHFLGDNERVPDQVNSLKSGDFKEFLAKVQASGDSSYKWLQNIYTNKRVNEQGVSLALAFSENYINLLGEGACRVHGGGFAGTIQVFLPTDAVRDYVRLIESVFGKGSVLILNIRSYGTVHLNTFVETSRWDVS